MRDKEHLKDQILGHLKLYEDMGVCWIGSPAAIDTPPKPAGISSSVSKGNPIEAIEKTRAYSSLFDQVSSVSESLDTIRKDLGDCRRCKLAANRMNIVFGSGNPQAELMFVGEAPGAEEDQQSLPFVGRAGQLLTKIVEAIEMSREDVYICNILKCRPPGNRNPEDDEIATCEPFLFRQIASVKPRVICALGAFGAQTLLKTRTPISRLRGHLIDYRGAKFMATFHPAYLLRNPNEKRKVWEDVQVIQRYLRSLGSSSKS